MSTASGIFYKSHVTSKNQCKHWFLHTKWLSRHQMERFSNKILSQEASNIKIHYSTSINIIWRMKGLLVCHSLTLNCRNSCVTVPCIIHFRWTQHVNQSWGTYMLFTTNIMESYKDLDFCYWCLLLLKHSHTIKSWLISYARNTKNPVKWSPLRYLDNINLNVFFFANFYS